jgi:succinyl-CoA synthetase beta subunit
MEEIIDFDSWLQQYTAPQVEYWAIFEPTTGEVTGIYPDPAADDKQYKIKIDSDLAEDIHNGIIQMSSCFVDIDSETIEIVTIFVTTRSAVVFFPNKKAAKMAA